MEAISQLYANSIKRINSSTKTSRSEGKSLEKLGSIYVPLKHLKAYNSFYSYSQLIIFFLKFSTTLALKGFGRDLFTGQTTEFYQSLWLTLDHALLHCILGRLQSSWHSLHKVTVLINVAIKVLHSIRFKNKGSIKQKSDADAWWERHNRHVEGERSSSKDTCSAL